MALRRDETSLTDVEPRGLRAARPNRISSQITHTVTAAPATSAAQRWCGQTCIRCRCCGGGRHGCGRAGIHGAAFEKCTAPTSAQSGLHARAHLGCALLAVEDLWRDLRGCSRRERAAQKRKRREQCRHLCSRVSHDQCVTNTRQHAWTKAHATVPALKRVAVAAPPLSLRVSQASARCPPTLCGGKIPSARCPRRRRHLATAAKSPGTHPERCTRGCRFSAQRPSLRARAQP